MGQELFVFDPALVVAPVCDPNTVARGVTAEAITAKQDEGETSTYPNPFSIGFTLRVNGPETGFYNAHITDLKGVNRETATALKYNTDYPFGLALAPGLYILIVDKRERVVMRIVKSQ